MNEETIKKMRKNELLELIESIIANINTINKKVEKINKNKRESDNMLSTHKQSITELKSNINAVNKNTEKVKEIRNNVERYQDIINNFAKKIAEQETQLNNQNTQTEKFNSRLEEFTTERDELLNTARELIEQAKKALGYRKAVDISDAVKTRYEEAEKHKGGWWIFAAIFFVFIGIALTVGFIIKYPEAGFSFSVTIARLSLITLPLASAWFCAGQYNKLKNIAEDYAYKTMLAQSIIGFSEQLKNDDEADNSYQDYMKKMLDELHQHPVPRHKKGSINKSLLEKIDDYQKLVEQAIKSQER